MPRSERCTVVALEYLFNQTPRVTRRGAKEAAAEILRDARRYGVPIVVDSELSNGLDGVLADEEIPEDLYKPVAGYLIDLKLA